MEKIKSNFKPINMLWLKVIIVVSLVELALAVGLDPFFPYHNEYRGELLKECPSGYGLSTVHSDHLFGEVKRHAVFGDRLWYWDCVKVDFLMQDYCEWTEPINDAGEPMFFQCPPDAFMAGVKSTYDRAVHDRVWEVKCCRILSVCMQHCYLSHVLANFTDDMPLYTARPDDHDGVFVGMYSAFNTDLGDREYHVAACQFDHCNYSPSSKELTVDDIMRQLVHPLPTRK